MSLTKLGLVAMHLDAPIYAHLLNTTARQKIAVVISPKIGNSNDICSRGHNIAAIGVNMADIGLRCILSMHINTKLHAANWKRTSKSILCPLFLKKNGGIKRFLSLSGCPIYPVGSTTWSVRLLLHTLRHQCRWTLTLSIYQITVSKLFSAGSKTPS
jgi:hypothetical protein